MQLAARRLAQNAILDDIVDQRQDFSRGVFAGMAQLLECGGQQLAISVAQQLFALGWRSAQKR